MSLRADYGSDADRERRGSVVDLAAMESYALGATHMKLCYDELLTATKNFSILRMEEAGEFIQQKSLDPASRMPVKTAPRIGLNTALQACLPPWLSKRSHRKRTAPHQLPANVSSRHDRPNTGPATVDKQPTCWRGEHW